MPRMNLLEPPVESKEAILDEYPEGHPFHLRHIRPWLVEVVSCETERVIDVWMLLPGIGWVGA